METFLSILIGLGVTMFLLSLLGIIYLPNRQKKAKPQGVVSAKKKEENKVAADAHNNDHHTNSAEVVFESTLNNRKRGVSGGAGCLLIILVVAGLFMSHYPMTEWLSQFVWIFVLLLVIRLLIGFIFNWGWWPSGLVFIGALMISMIVFGWPRGLAHRYDPLEGNGRVERQDVEQAVRYVFEEPDSTRIRAKEPATNVTMTITCDGTTYDPPLKRGVTYIFPLELDEVDLMILPAGETQAGKYGPRAQVKWIGINNTHTKQWADAQQIFLDPPCAGQEKKFTLRPIPQK